MIHALDFVGDVAAQVVHVDHRVGVVVEDVGHAQRHHRGRQVRLHVQRAVAPARVVDVAGQVREGLAGQAAVMDEDNRLVALRDRQHPHDLVMELSASYAQSLGGTDSLFVYAGLPVARTR